VLITHYQFFFTGKRLWGQDWLNLGQHGVTIFFILSGYLITTKLLQRERIDLRDFYVRRFFRLMPAAWAYLFVLCLLTWLTSKTYIGNDLWGCLLFFRNHTILTQVNVYTGQFWTLAIEEQFYFIWPMSLVLLGKRRAAVLAVVAAAGVAAYRLAYLQVYRDGRLFFHHTELMYADKLLVGCLLAFAMTKEQTRNWFRRNSTVILSLCVIPVVADFYYCQTLVPLHEAIFIAMMIGATSMNPETVASRILDLAHIRTTGQLSYSLYLWQQLLFRSTLGPLALLTTPVAALFSWRFIEQPSIKLGRRILSNAKQATDNRAERSDVQPIAVLANGD
jgi:peptidoglycan/LPS O-acetylase OafA/YrhL